MTEPITGGCACGAIRYECTAEPIVCAHCQCLDCQRFSGAGHFSTMFVPLKAVTLTGTLKFYETIADNGKTVRRGFCPDCGSPVFGQHARRPQFGVLSAGSLDDPGRFVPSFVVYAGRGHAWDVMDPALPAFPGMPPSRDRP